MNKLNAYVDGACSNNPGIGGLGIVICDENFKILKKIAKGVKDTTNNRMELTAVIWAMEYAINCNVPSIDIFSDSSYVVNAINMRWLQNWILNGWKTAKGEEVKNKDLWEYFIKIAPKVSFKLFKVKGHANNALNNLADSLAVMARESVENAIDN